MRWNGCACLTGDSHINGKMTISMRGLLAVSLLAASTVLSAELPQQAPAPATLAQVIQAHYGSVTSFTAGFTHTFKGESNEVDDDD